MIFKGQPNLFVRISSKFVQRTTGKKGFYFDENGRYETDNEILCKLLKQNFEVEETEVSEPAKEEELKKIYNCKHCNFKTENKGELLIHYKQHKKGE